MSKLTKREKEVLNLIIKGKKNMEVADILYISEKTVKCHVSSIILKLEVKNRVQAAIKAVIEKLV